MNDERTILADVALRNAQSRRDEIAAKVNQLEQEIESYRRELKRTDDFIVEWHRYAGTEKPEDIPGPGLEFAVASPSRPRHNSKKEIVARHARALIEDAGEPLMRSDLFAKLIEHGLVIEGSDPEMVLSTMLWRMKDKAKIARLKNGGYWLAEFPYEPAGYKPKSKPESLTERIERLGSEGLDRLAQEIEEKLS